MGGGPVDERGVLRPQGGGCDLGAFESAADASVSLAATPEPVAVGGLLSLTANVTDASVLAECVYVLESFYEVGRTRVADLMRAAIALPSVAVLDSQTLLRSLEVYETERLVACAEATGVGRILSLNRSIDRVKTVSRIET